MLIHPAPPEGSYAVIFTSRRKAVTPGYEQTAERMLKLAAEQNGFLGVRSFADDDGMHVTISYWRDTDAISHWRQQVEHREAQRQGREDWYSEYRVEICRLERSYDLLASQGADGEAGP